MDSKIEALVIWEKADILPVVQKSALTKENLKLLLQQGHTLNDLLAFSAGQDCEIL